MLDKTKQDDGIPAFLRITADARRVAWERSPPRPMPRFDDTSTRRSNLNDHDREVIAALLAGEEARRRRKTDEGLAELDEHKARKRGEEAERAAVASAAREAQAGFAKALDAARSGPAKGSKATKTPKAPKGSVAKKPQPAKKVRRK